MWQDRRPLLRDMSSKMAFKCGWQKWSFLMMGPCISGYRNGGKQGDVLSTFWAPDLLTHDLPSGPAGQLFYPLPFGCNSSWASGLTFTYLTRRSTSMPAFPFFLSCTSCSLVQANPDVAMDCVIHMTQHLSRAQRTQVAHLLATMDNPTSSWQRPLPR